MKEEIRIKQVAFAEEATRNAFDKLKQGKFEDKNLYEFIDRAIDDLKENPFVGIKISKKLWPKEYAQKYKINNLWKYNLPNAWRLLYTMRGDSIKIIAVILEWLDHTSYSRKFGYRKK
ncbi:type II toxin-antitoxin system YoeB family toxin [Candidatus Micrarchaeota archaeon]|nr:type II toxin-antitoxin system YoeB family toxin [Candidatus Micrarchaeota archaeon]MBU2476817.1 type II toxin-antitoxin system YoeB family toxin [Candidatus Micrarchaeota archaeon]